jgi:hypothetical protein
LAAAAYSGLLILEHVTGYNSSDEEWSARILPREPPDPSSSPSPRANSESVTSESAGASFRRRQALREARSPVAVLLSGTAPLRLKYGDVIGDRVRLPLPPKAVVKEPKTHPLRNPDADVVLRRILEGTASETGVRFFEVLVENLAKALGTRGAWVTEYDPRARRLSALAFWWAGEFLEYEYDIEGTPCQLVIDKSELVHIPENVVALFPGDPDLPKFGAVSYLGAPLYKSASLPRKDSPCMSGSGIRIWGRPKPRFSNWSSSRWEL